MSANEGFFHLEFDTYGEKLRQILGRNTVFGGVGLVLSYRFRKVPEKFMNDIRAGSSK